LFRCSFFATGDTTCSINRLNAETDNYWKTMADLLAKYVEQMEYDMRSLKPCFSPPAPLSDGQFALADFAWGTSRVPNKVPPHRSSGMCFSCATFDGGFDYGCGLRDMKGTVSPALVGSRFASWQLFTDSEYARIGILADRAFSMAIDQTLHLGYRSKAPASVYVCDERVMLSSSSSAYPTFPRVTFTAVEQDRMFFIGPTRHTYTLTMNGDTWTVPVRLGQLEDNLFDPFTDHDARGRFMTKLWDTPLVEVAQWYRDNSLKKDVDLGDKPSTDAELLAFMNRAAGAFSIAWSPWFLLTFGVYDHLTTPQKAMLDDLLFGGTACWRQGEGMDCHHYTWSPFHNRVKRNEDDSDTTLWGFRVESTSAPAGFHYMFRQARAQLNMNSLPVCEAPLPNQRGDFAR